MINRRTHDDLFYAGPERRLSRRMQAPAPQPIDSNDDLLNTALAIETATEVADIVSSIDPTPEITVPDSPSPDFSFGGGDSGGGGASSEW